MKALLILALALLSQQAHAAETLRWSGPIDRTFEAAVAAGRPRTLVLGSAGGDYDVAVRVGRYVRAHRVRTVAVGDCQSACSMVWAAGSPRGASPGARLMFHVPGIDRCVGRPCDGARAEAEEANGMYYAYLAEMGVPERTVWLIRNQPPTQPAGLRGNVLELADLWLAPDEVR